MKIMAVCGLGMGSSLILRMNIEEVLKNHGVKATVEHSDASSASSERCDYIVTTKEIAKSMQTTIGKVVKLNNFVDKKEIKKVLKENGII